jgi:ectoine hydroxylase-related dioxygenase (phytanoyl-CoA dioxygenase family)
VDGYPQAIERDGFAVVPDAVPPELVDQLAASVEPLLAPLTRVQGGVRDVLSRCEMVRELAGSAVLRRWVEPILGGDCVAVGALLFDKADGRNWKVPYHQDITIRVRARRDVLGFGPWWEKAGVPHTWPPAGVVERMLAVRVHLDDCGPDNGPLRVIPGSHRAGVLESAAIDEWKARGPEAACVVGRGGLVLMRPLLLHASSTATQVRRRRVIHIEYAAPELPGGLDWYEHVGASADH